MDDGRRHWKSILEEFEELRPNSLLTCQGSELWQQQTLRPAAAGIHDSWTWTFHLVGVALHRASANIDPVTGYNYSYPVSWELMLLSAVQDLLPKPPRAPGFLSLLISSSVRLRALMLGCSPCPDLALSTASRQTPRLWHCSMAYHCLPWGWGLCIPTSGPSHGRRNEGKILVSSKTSECFLKTILLDGK